MPPERLKAARPEGPVRRSLRAGQAIPRHGRRRARTGSCATASVRSGDAYHSAFRTCRVGETTGKRRKKRPKAKKGALAAFENRNSPYVSEERKNKRPPAGDLPSRIHRSTPRSQPESTEPIEPSDQLLMRVQQPSGFFLRGFPSSPSSSRRSGFFVENQR